MDRIRHSFPNSSRIAFAAVMLFVLSLSGMMGWATKASAVAAGASGLAVYCAPGEGKGQADAPVHHCDTCLVQTQRDPAPDLSALEGQPIALPSPVATRPVAQNLREEPATAPLLVRRSAPPRAPPANI